jgi:hypothetical protein
VYFSISGIAQELCKCSILLPRQFDGLLMTFGLASINLGLTKLENTISTKTLAVFRKIYFVVPNPHICLNGNKTVKQIGVVQLLRSSYFWWWTWRNFPYCYSVGRSNPYKQSLDNRHASSQLEPLV